MCLPNSKTYLDYLERAEVTPHYIINKPICNSVQHDFGLDIFVGVSGKTTDYSWFLSMNFIKRNNCSHCLHFIITILSGFNFFSAVLPAFIVLMRQIKMFSWF